MSAAAAAARGGYNADREQRRLSTSRCTRVTGRSCTATERRCAASWALCSTRCSVAALASRGGRQRWRDPRDARGLRRALRAGHRRRPPGRASEDGLRRGLGHVRSIVGKAYDYAFQATTTAIARRSRRLSEVNAWTPLQGHDREVGLLRTSVYEPVALWGPPAVIANSAARAQFAERLGVHILE